MEVRERFFIDPGVSFFLFGPRGTGKSTWLKMQYTENVLYVDMLSPELFRLYSARPERIKELIDGNPDTKIVIVDEIQKVPVLLDIIHQIIEQNKNLRFILTGSSSRKLKRTGVDLLAGRVVYKTLHPFMAAEMGNDFNLGNALKFGLVPLIVSSDNPVETLNTYVALYLNEEVKMEGLVRNIGNFSRFLEVISFSNGSLLNISEIARESQVGRKAVEGYISILEDILLAYKLPVFSKRAKRQLIAHPKFYFFDVGIYRSIRPSGPLDSPHEIDGIALENLVLQHLVSWNAYNGNVNKLYYWRTKAGLEVDFIIYGPETLTAIEVKNTAAIRSNDLKGLKSFKVDYPSANCLFLYRGDEKLKIDEILCLPVELFLVNILPGKDLIEIN